MPRRYSRTPEIVLLEQPNIRTCSPFGKICHGEALMLSAPRPLHILGANAVPERSMSYWTMRSFPPLPTPALKVEGIEQQDDRSLELGVDSLVLWWSCTVVVVLAAVPQGYSTRTLVATTSSRRSGLPNMWNGRRTKSVFGRLPHRSDAVICPAVAGGTRPRASEIRGTIIMASINPRQSRRMEF